MVDKKEIKKPTEEKSKKILEDIKERKIELKLPLNSKKIKTWLIIILAAFFVLPLFLPAAPKEISLSQAILDIKQGKVKQVDVSEDILRLEYKDNNEVAETRKEPQDSIYELA